LATDVRGIKRCGGKDGGGIDGNAGRGGGAFDFDLFLVEIRPVVAGEANESIDADLLLFILDFSIGPTLMIGTLFISSRRCFSNSRRSSTSIRHSTAFLISSRA